MGGLLHSKKRNGFENATSSHDDEENTGSLHIGRKITQRNERNPGTREGGENSPRLSPPGTRNST